MNQISMSLFISFEGPDGSSRSTQVQLLSDALTLRER
jgi:thymidylate kinase